MADEYAWQPSLGVRLVGGTAHARVWAPDAATVAVRDAAGIHPDVPLEPEPGGYFAGRVPWLHAGARYWIVVDDRGVFPDPASRAQPDGVHGPSEAIDAGRFAWRDAGWRGRPIEELAIYELHVGTFTPEGTFAAAAARLDALADLGVTAVELMPVAAFPGRWNWGYDPAAQFAPSEAYGSPDDLRALVDRAHALGLCVLLDVVYNHFGPDGAYAAACSPAFFSARHRSPWGAGINLDGPGAAGVRRFFIENALHWVRDYHIDGLRLDATHALVDDGPEPFMAALAGAIRASVPDRHVVLVAEDNRNLRAIAEPAAAGGWGFDGVWSDDFHHIARRLAAGDDEGYYRDYQGTTAELARALRDGWLYRGEPSVHAGGPRGTDPADLPLAAFVICLQNHDQVGNRPTGDRLTETVDAAAVRALTLLLLLAPETPLLFMGEEWAASTPFQYFTDHAGDLGRQVREGRREEFGHFRAFVDPAGRERIPDPQDPETFARSRLLWDERARQPHAGMLALHREALRLRWTLAPAGRSGTLGDADVAAAGPHAIVMRRTARDGTAILVAAQLAGAGSVRVPNGAALTRVLDTEAAGVAPDPRPIGLIVDHQHLRVAFARPGGIVLRSSAPAREAGES